MIRINNLAFSYGQDDVLKNITMSLEKGRIYGLLGENGVGKTTLLTLLCGLKKAKQGSISVDGENPWDRHPSLLSRQYYLPDEVIALPYKAEAWAKSCMVFWPCFDFNTFASAMKEFEVDMQMKMNSMSAGQLKKTYISFALATKADYLYMDEPTNGLDIPSKSQFRSAILKYTKEDATIVISTHQVRDLEDLIDPIIILDRQAVLANNSLEEISKALYFDYGTTLNPDSLYTEQLPGGFIQVYENKTGEESKVNIEAFFNTVHKHKELSKNILKHE